MSKLQYVMSQSSDDISVEVNGDNLCLDLNDYGGSGDIFSEIFSLEKRHWNDDSVHGFCESDNVIESIASYDEFNDFGKYLLPTGASSVDIKSNCSSVNDLFSEFKFDIDENLFSTDDWTDFSNDKVNNAKLNQEMVPLSFSVGVGVPQRVIQPHKKIEIVCDLEETFRPRYKSDYYAQNGRIRKPRYVADRHGNHYVTLKISPGIQGKIRVDWLTVPNNDGERYMMPYRFQESHESCELKDCNPLYLDIKTDDEGIMKLYLVLIKAKQDALKSLQPLQLFQPFHNILGVENMKTTEKWFKLTPKQLIKQYQLGKSQLAFTLCTPNIDGKTYTTEWNTTAFSTVLTEDGVETSTTKAISCPKCACEIYISEGSTMNQGIATIKRKKIQSSDTEIIKMKKKRRKYDPILGLEWS